MDANILTEGFQVLSDCRSWKYERRFPVRRLINRKVGDVTDTSVRDWMLWFEDERDEDPEYYNALESEWLADPESVGPVVIGIKGRTLDIGDGWHRVAIAVAHGMKYIPAMVGSGCTLL